MQTDSKTSEKRKAREVVREAFVESKFDADPAAEIMASRIKAKEAFAVAEAIKTLQQVVPNWPRRERRALAKAMRLGGQGYTKNTHV